MRILIAYQYFSFKGGIEHVIAAQAEGLAAQGHDVALLTSSYLDDSSEGLDSNVDIFRLKSVNYLYEKHGIPFSIPLPTPRNLRLLRKVLGEVDVVNIHGHPYLFSLCVTLMANARRVPVVLTQHNTAIRSGNPVLDAIYKVAERTISRCNIKRATIVVAVSEETKRYDLSLAPGEADKMIRIYNGIDHERFAPHGDRAATRERLGLPAERFLCFTVRRITFKNGIDTLLRAAELNRDPNVHFVIGGSGPDLSAARSYAADKRLDNVLLLGSISDADLPAYYAASDVFVLPSRQGEGFPMVVLEAFASGLPVIATRSGGHVEIIDEPRTGFLVDVDAPAQINEKIAQLTSRGLDRASISARCRALVQERFTWRQNVTELLQAIDRARKEDR